MPTTRSHRITRKKRAATDQVQLREARWSAIANQFSRAVPADMTDKELERVIDQAVEEVRQERHERQQACRTDDAG